MAESTKQVTDGERAGGSLAQRAVDFLGLRRSMVALLTMVVLVGLGEKMAERFLPVYLIALGGSTLSVGLLNGMDNLLSALYSYPGGYISDRLGYKGALLVFNLIALLGYLIVILFPTWQMVIVGSIFFISWTAISLPATMSMVSEVLPSTKRTMGVSIHSLVRRIRKNGVRLAVTLGVSLVGFLVVVLAFSFVGYMASVNLPQRYASLTSPDGGHRLVVLRSYEFPDDEHIALRQDARREAEPEVEADLVAEDWGFAYAAYPRALNIFYRADADVQGEVHLGYASAATLMVEWPDGDTARFYVQDPEPGDDGECTLKFK